MSFPNTPPAKAGLGAASNDQLVLSIEGNIGIGKSTLLGGLRRRFANHPDVVFVDEPVELWEKSGLLQAMYTNTIDKCSFQQMAVITRFGALKRAIETGATLIITERSVYTDRECFAKVGVTSKDEIAAYAVTHDSLCQTLPADIKMATVLLEAPLDVIARRIRMRGRAAEQEATMEDDGGAEGGGVPDVYLQALQEAHAAYFASLGADEKVCVDATASPAKVEADVYAACVGFRKGASSSPATVFEPLDAALPTDMDAGAY